MTRTVGLKVKAITLTQPWAQLVAIGAKRIETRSWSTSYRGPVAIHAAKGLPRDVLDLCSSEPFFSALVGAGVECTDQCPRGAVIATARLAAVRRITEELIWGPKGLAERDWWADECEFGDYTLGRFAWFLADVKAVAEPIPAKGQLGLWDWAGQ